MACGTCFQTRCTCNKVTGSTLNIVPVTTSCTTPPYCVEGCEETLLTDCVVTPSLHTYCFLKDKYGHPIIKGTSVQNILEGLDILLCNLKSRLDDCCGVTITRALACGPTGKCKIVMLKRNGITITSNQTFNTPALLLAYLKQYDNFVAVGQNIVVDSSFVWTLDLICLIDECALEVIIIPPYTQDECLA